ncbi:MAG: hypothetical protein GY796_01880 [Chloroflexi bacterium]|nr:hypothetical protein [Chloroflexota bacterium]
MFKGCLLQVCLHDALGERDTAVNSLHQMILDFPHEKYQAEIHFYCWQISGDEMDRDTAVHLYQNLLKQTSNYQYRQYLNALLRNEIGFAYSVRKLAIDRIEEMKVQQNVFLSVALICSLLLTILLGFSDVVPRNLGIPYFLLFFAFAGWVGYANAIRRINRGL